MQQRKLGINGPAVPALGLGCMGMSIAYGEPDDAESIATIHRALELVEREIDEGKDFGESLCFLP